MTDGLNEIKREAREEGYDTGRAACRNGGYVAALERLWDMLSDAIEGGRLTEADVPDDYQAFVAQMTEVERARDTLAGAPDVPPAGRALDVAYDVFETERGLSIQRDDEAGLFGCDDDAVAYVHQRAVEGCPRARRALRVVADQHPVPEGMYQGDDAEKAAYRAQARADYADDPDVSVDDSAGVSVSDSGAFVAAWLWVDAQGNE